MYYAGRSQMFWMRLTEENNAAAIQTLLNLRGFHVRTISQIVIGNSMPVAEKLCSPSDGRHFAVSPFIRRRRSRTSSVMMSRCVR